MAAEKKVQEKPPERTYAVPQSALLTLLAPSRHLYPDLQQKIEKSEALTPADKQTLAAALYWIRNETDGIKSRSTQQSKHIRWQNDQIRRLTVDLRAAGEVRTHLSGQLSDFIDDIEMLRPLVRSHLGFGTNEDRAIARRLAEYLTEKVTTEQLSDFSKYVKSMKRTSARKGIDL